MGQGHNELTGIPQLQQGVRIALGERGALWTGLERLDESLAVSFNPWDLIEHALPRGEIWYAREVVSPAVAARFSACEILNPSGSQVITVIKALQQISSGVNVQAEINVGNAVGANQVIRRGVPVDGRAINNAGGIGESSRTTLVQSDVGAGVSLPQLELVNNVVYTDEMVKWVLTPGTKLNLFGTVVNIAINFQIRFTERPVPLVEQIGR